MKRCVTNAVSMLPLFATAAMAQYTDWSAPANLGAPVNSPYMDTCPSLSKNGLAIYFASNRHTANASSPNWDLYVSARASVKDPWGVPQQVPNVNSDSMESCPALSPDEYRLYFVSNRSGGCGGADLYVSPRTDRKDDLGWAPPVNAGCATDGGVNSPSNEFTPSIFEDETGTEVVYLSSDRPGSAAFDIYASRMKADDTFGPAAPVAELNTAFGEQGFAVRRDGLEIVFGSNRTGSVGDMDLWTAARDTTADPWSAPVRLSYLMNSVATDGGKMSFSFDGRQLYFRSNRAAWGNFLNFGASLGSGDIYVATRVKLPTRK